MHSIELCVADGGSAELPLTRVTVQTYSLPGAEMVTDLEHYLAEGVIAERTLIEILESVVEAAFRAVRANLMYVCHAHSLIGCEFCLPVVWISNHEPGNEPF